MSTKHTAVWSATADGAICVNGGALAPALVAEALNSMEASIADFIAASAAALDLLRQENDGVERWDDTAAGDVAAGLRAAIAKAKDRS